LEELFLNNPDAGACFTRHRFINEGGDELAVSPVEATESGILADWLERIASKQIIQYAAIAVRREVYEELGGFYGVTYGEDWEMWVRIASRYPFAYCPEVLAEYRVHSNSISGEKFLTGQNTRDLLWVMRVIQGYLPVESRARIWRASTLHYAKFGLSVADSLWKKHGNRRAARRQLLEAFRLCPKPEILWGILKLHLKILKNSR
jgi:hypothetical protein